MPKRKKLFVHKHKGIGTPPGSLPDSVDNNKQTLQFPINNINYDSNLFEKHKLIDLQELEAEIQSITESATALIHWIDINSLSDLNAIKTIGEKLSIHPLVLEDITHTHQRPKFEDWDHYIYVVVKMIYLNNSKEIINEQVSFILGKNYLISFQEHDSEVFNIIRKRLEVNKGRIRKMQADYLMYCLLDIIADNYFLVLDTINERLIQIEDQTETKHVSV
jgi:magnesium transporter